jgi:SulP family sulfate permease
MLIFGLEGEMFFGAGSSLERHFDTIEDRIGPDTRALVLRLKRARNPDAVGIAMLEGTVDRVRARGVQVVLCGVRAGMLSALENSGLAAKLGEENIFLEQPVRQTSTVLAIRHVYAGITDYCATCPRRHGAPLPRALYYEI